MKINNIILISITIFSCQNYSNDVQKDVLLGNWSTVLSGNQNQLTFYKDSIIFNEFGLSYIGKWEIDSTRIYLNPIKDSKKIPLKSMVLDYQLNKTNDTLHIKNQKDSLFRYPFLKIQNKFDYLEKINGFNIELEEKPNLIQTGHFGHDINVYVGYKNSKIIVKTDRFNNLYKINTEANELFFLDEGIDTSQVNYNLIIDKRIPKSKVDSIKNILTNTVIKKFFRIYTNKYIDYRKTDWKEEIDWFGIPE